jgi:hypothetical protein
MITFPDRRARGQTRAGFVATLFPSRTFGIRRRWVMSFQFRSPPLLQRSRIGKTIDSNSFDGIRCSSRVKGDHQLGKV